MDYVIIIIIAAGIANPATTQLKGQVIKANTTVKEECETKATEIKKSLEKVEVSIVKCELSNMVGI